MTEHPSPIAAVVELYDASTAGSCNSAATAGTAAPPRSSTPVATTAAG